MTFAGIVEDHARRECLQPAQGHRQAPLQAGASVQCFFFRKKGRKEGHFYLYFPATAGQSEPRKHSACRIKNALSCNPPYLSNSSNEDCKIPSFLDILLLHHMLLPRMKSASYLTPLLGIFYLGENARHLSNSIRHF